MFDEDIQAEENAIVVTVSKKGVRLDKALFGNSLYFNKLVLVTKDKIPWSPSGIGPKISHILDYGIVVSSDSCEQGDDDNDGFHNFFIPWSQIKYVYQYIAT